MKVVVNPSTGLRELVVKAFLKSVGTEIRCSEPTEANPEGIEFFWCEVQITYPRSGMITIVDSILLNKYVVKQPDSFVAGREIPLIIQLEGKGAGGSKVGLPTLRRVDITQFDLIEFNLEEEEIEEEIEEEENEKDDFKLKNIFNSYAYLSIMKNENEPSYLTRLLTSNYFSEYLNPYDLVGSAYSLISGFYVMHYGGKNITTENIEKIAYNFYDNLPLLILCVYLIDIVGDDDMVILCMMNKEITYKIILDVYNEVCPPNEELAFEFSDTIELKILDCLE